MSTWYGYEQPLGADPEHPWWRWEAVGGIVSSDPYLTPTWIRADGVTVEGTFDEIDGDTRRPERGVARRERGHHYGRGR